MEGRTHKLSTRCRRAIRDAVRTVRSTPNSHDVLIDIASESESKAVQAFLLGPMHCKWISCGRRYFDLGFAFMRRDLVRGKQIRLNVDQGLYLWVVDSPSAATLGVLEVELQESNFIYE